MIDPRVRRFVLPALFAIVATLAGAEASWAQPKPNVILLLSDDAGYADMGFMSPFTGEATQFKTPNIDALASQSKVFTNSYMAASVCSVARAGLLTGRNPQRFNFEYNVIGGVSVYNGVPTSEVTMAEAMKQAGYKTSMFGKWHLGFEATQLPNAQGFDEFYGIQAGGRPHFGVGASVYRNSTITNWQTEPSFNNIPEDPALGRMLTDAIGDEASKYVSQNANQAQPFFMYVPFTAPHEPYDLAKAQDLAQLDSTSLVGYRKNVAALTLAMDRAVGNIMARVNDPNGDGNTSDSIASNTIIVFANDNGGARPVSDPTLPLPNTTEIHDNGPLRDYKGWGWEGGIRTAMTIKMPGGAAGVSNEMVSAIDLMPTFLAAAGATIPANVDGKSLTPLLNGTQVGAVHDALFWRGGKWYWAIRKGDWKLVKGSEAAGVQLYHLNADGSGESVSFNNTDPTRYRSMLNEFVDWEATIGKPTQNTSYPENRFDAFRFQQDQATTSNWRDAIWQDDANPGAVVGINRDDPYANAALVFKPRNDASYTSNNNISRLTGHYYTSVDAGINSPDGLKEFMLNELRFNGQFSGPASQSGTLTGFPLLFVKNLSGAGPKIRLDSTSSVAGTFSFNLNMDVVLHSGLEITGNSTQPFVMNGQIRDFDEAMSLTKTGTSTVKLTSNNIYFGSTVVNGGTLRVDGPSAALANTSMVQIGAQGTVVLAAGRIHTPVVDIANGGTFTFSGGILETAQVNGNLTNAGGNFKPGLSVAATSITGDYSQSAASTFTMEIGGVAPGTQYDRVIVGDDVALAGALQVLLVNLGGGTFNPAVGNTFEIIKAADTFTGTFTSINVPTLTGGKKWAIQYSPRSASLTVVTGLAADFDHNNVVNAADLTVWRSSLGMSMLGDADLDGDTDGNDFLIWQRQVGLQIVPSLEAAAAAVPEPSSLMLLMAAIGGAPRLLAHRVSRRSRGT